MQHTPGAVDRPVSGAWKMAGPDSAPLLAALAASMTIHAGLIAGFEAAWEGDSGSRETKTIARPSLLRATLSGMVADTRPPPHDLVADTGKSSRRGIIEVPTVYYFPPAELDRKPEPVREVPLTYPSDLPLVKRGNVVLNLLIDENGKINKIIVETADAPGELAEVAARAFAGALFRPGLRDSQAVKSRLRIEVTFEGDQGNTE